MGESGFYLHQCAQYRFSNSEFRRCWIGRVLPSASPSTRQFGDRVPRTRQDATTPPGRAEGKLSARGGRAAWRAGHPAVPRQGGKPGGGRAACRFLALSPAGGGQCDTDSRTCPRARRGCPAPTLLGRDAPRSTRPARPVSQPLARPPGQPGGVAHGQPAPLMCAGAAVIGWALVTCGDCGGPGCCGCRSARRGSGSGSPAFKGDAAAAPGMGGRWKGQSRSTSSTVPRGWRDS